MRCIYVTEECKCNFSDLKEYCEGKGSDMRECYYLIHSTLKSISKEGLKEYLKDNLKINITQSFRSNSYAFVKDTFKVELLLEDEVISTSEVSV